MSDVFISYVEEDEALAVEIARGLEAAGYQTWYYSRDSLAGPKYLAQTMRAIDDARAVVLLISRDSLSSYQIDKEVDYAHEANKPFVPLLRGVTHPEFQARRPTWRMAVGTATSVVIPSDGIAAVLPRIIGGLKALEIEPGKPAVETPVPPPEDPKISPLTEAIRQNPENPVAHYDLGMAYRNRFNPCDYERAIAEFTEAIRLKPEYREAYIERAWIYTFALNDFDRGIADYTEAIRLKPVDPDAYNLRGIAYMQKGDLDRAIADLTDAILRDPTDFQIFRTRASVYDARGDYDRAVADYDEAVRLTPPGNFAVYVERGIARVHQGDYEGAIADATESIRIEPTYVKAYEVRAGAFAKTGQDQRAIADFTEAIRLHLTRPRDRRDLPQLAAAYLGRSAAYRRTGHTALADADHRHAIAMDPTLGELRSEGRK